MARFLGIDPGLHGAIAVFDDIEGTVTAYDMPTHQLTRGGKNKLELDQYGLARLIRSLAVGVKACVIEQVGAMPKQGVSSSFAFGKAYGSVIAAVAAHDIQMHFAPPMVWKRALKVPSSKDGARARASQLLPRGAHQWARAKDDGRAEASLLAYFMATAGVVTTTPAERKAVGAAPLKSDARLGGRHAGTDGPAPVAEENRGMSVHQRTALENLAKAPAGKWTNAGKHSGSAHALRALVRRGYVRQRTVSPDQPYMYQITPAGREANDLLTALGM